MSKITGKDLLELGFQKSKNVPLDAMDSEYHYYTYEVGKATLLISNTNDEKVNGGYEVEFYDIQGLTFKNLIDLKKLIKLLIKANV